MVSHFLDPLLSQRLGTHKINTQALERYVHKAIRSSIIIRESGSTQYMQMCDGYLQVSSWYTCLSLVPSLLE